MKSKNKQIKKILKTVFIFTLIFSWIFSGWPQVWQNIEFPPKIQRARATVETFTTAGTFTDGWTAPAGVTSVTAETWGGGGGSGGGTVKSGPGGSGGGGGAYAKKVITVTPSSSYTYVVGAAGLTSGGAAGGSSSFTGDASAQSLACGGTSGADDGGAAGTGGTIACSDGTTEFAGGAGAAGAGTSGGGGGESAGTTATGGSAIGTTGGTGTDGTDGSAGQLVNIAGLAGNSPGAGAGGAGGRSGGSKIGASGGVGQVRLTYVIPATTTLTNGASEPSSVTIAPGAGITDLDNFTFYTSADTDTVTAAVVTLGPANAYNNIHQVDITNTSNVAQCTAVTSLSSNIVSFPTSTCNISITTTDTTYKVRITPKAHGDMPVVPGASYVTTGTVTGFTSTNTQSGSDSGSAEITVDNLSPNGADPTSGSAGNAQVTLNWTASNSSDFNTTSGSVIYRWAAGSAGSEVPDEGSTPSIGSTNGTAIAACVVSSAASTPLSKIDGSGGSAECTTAALTNGQAYSYKVFQKDNNGNYDAGVIFTSSPFTPIANSPPSISISQPDGASDTVVVGTSYDITYTLSDSDDIVTAAFYYDTDNTGLNGVAITGPCATAAEGSGVTCAWNTTGMTPGSYYVYGITDDGINPAENAYSSGQITINAQSLTFSISNSAIDFGTLGAIAARFATTNASSGGSTTETVAHTLVASTNVSGGYIITVEGATLTHSVNGSFAVDAITSTAVDVTLGGSIGTEQFGLRLTKSGTGSVTSPYDGSANFYVYDGTASSASQIASGAGDGTSTTFSVYSAANIAANTEAGIYETAFTYICTAAF